MSRTMIAPPPPVALVARLSDPDYRTRMKAARTLRYFHRQHALLPLLALLADEHKSVRARAAQQLGKLKDKRAVEPLIALLDEPSALVRTHAIEALGQLQATGAIGPLVNLLGDARLQVRSTCIRVLGQLGDPRVVEALLPFLTDDQRVRYETIEALGKLRDDRATDALVLASLNATDNTSFGSCAAIALAKISSEHALDSLLILYQRETASGTDRGWFVLRALGYLSERSGLPYERAVDFLLECLQCADFGIVTEAAEALGRLQARRAVEPLLTILRTRLEMIGRLYLYDPFTSALAQIGDARAVEPLLQMVEASAGITLYALWNFQEAVEPLLQMLQDETKTAFFPEIVTALGHIGDLRAVEPLLQLLDQYPDDTIRALGNLKDRRATEPLLNLLAQTCQEKMQVQIIQALGQLRDPLARNALSALARHRNLNVSFDAERALRLLRKR